MAFGEELVHSNELEDLWPKEGSKQRSEYVTKMMKVGYRECRQPTRDVDLYVYR